MSQIINNNSGGSGTIQNAGFVSYLSTNTINTAGDGIYRNLICDVDTHDINGNYDTSTGLFHIPYTGSYVFTVQYAIYNSNSISQTLYDLSVNLYTSSTTYTLNGGVQSVMNPLNTGSVTGCIYLYLNSGDYVGVSANAYVEGNSGLHLGVKGYDSGTNTYYTTFSGKYLY